MGKNQCHTRVTRERNQIGNLTLPYGDVYERKQLREDHRVTRNGMVSSATYRYVLAKQIRFYTISFFKRA